MDEIEELKARNKELEKQIYELTQEVERLIGIRNLLATVGTIVCIISILK